MSTELSARLPAGTDAERTRFAARDRVMLYLRGMDIGVLPSLELAAEAMRRAGPDARPEEALTHLHVLLKRQGLEPFLTDTEGQKLCSTPPLNRHSMLSEKAGDLTFYGAGKNLLISALGLFTRKETSWKKRRA